jgi:hypothetical protein
MQEKIFHRFDVFGEDAHFVRRVLTLGNERQKIAFIRSLDEAVPALAANYEKNPPRWKGGAKAKEYRKWTFYGVLTAARQGPSEWSAARNTDFLEHDGMWAVFKTAREAMRAADNHMRDGFADYPVLNDGYSWET